MNISQNGDDEVHSKVSVDMNISQNGDDEVHNKVSVEMQKMFANLRALYPPELRGYSRAISQIETALWKELNTIHATSSRPSREFSKME